MITGFFSINQILFYMIITAKLDDLFFFLYSLYIYVLAVCTFNIYLSNRLTEEYVGIIVS